MDTLTHALLPVLVTRLALPRATWAVGGKMAAIGIAGAAPDLINPHFSLEARMTSWSHGLPFWCALTVVLLMVSLWKKTLLPWQLGGALSLAYLLHMACDAISGGINWGYPVRDLPWGKYWVNPIWWIPLDIACVIAWYLVFRYLPWLRRVREGG